MTFSPGRRLADPTPGSDKDSNTTSESFTKDGMSCTGYTHREGKQYCKKPYKKEDGSNACHEYGTIYEGSVCEAWGEEKVKVTVSSTNSSEMTNPEYIKA